jgi:hypothetical protein
MFAQTEPTFDFYKNNSYKYLHFSELQQLTGKIFDYDGMASSFNYQMLPYLTAQINIFWYVFINMNVYINPPFSNIANVLKFAYDSGHIGSSFTVVVPVKPEQDWFYRYRPPEDQIILRHKKGDIVFEDSIRGLKLPCTFDVEVWRIDSATKPVGLSIPVKLINAIPRSFDDWHKILHICGDYMKKLKKSTYDFTVKGKDTLTTPCDVCLKARKSTPSIPTDPHAVRVTTPETEFGVDWVPFSTTGYNGETGAFIYFDLASGRIHSFPAKTKSASTKSLLWIIAKTSKVPSKIHFDDDVIFTEGDYMDTLLIFGIGHKISPAFRHEFNAAEGPIGHLRVGVRTLLFQGKMPPMFWPQSLAQYANIRNYTFGKGIKTTVKDSPVQAEQTEYQKLSMAPFFPFGCKTLAKDFTASALQEQKLECVYMGALIDFHTFGTVILLNLETGMFIKRHVADCNFFEDTPGGPQLTEWTPDDDKSDDYVPSEEYVPPTATHDSDSRYTVRTNHPRPVLMDQEGEHRNWHKNDREKLIQSLERNPNQPRTTRSGRFFISTVKPITTRAVLKTAEKIDLKDKKLKPDDFHSPCTPDDNLQYFTEDFFNSCSTSEDSNHTVDKGRVNKASKSFSLEGDQDTYYSGFYKLKKSAMPILATTGRVLRCLIFSLATISMVAVNELLEPTSYLEAKSMPDWYQASWDEYNKLLNMGCFEDISIHNVPKGEKIIGTRMVYKQKRDGTKKARLVAKGYMQTSFFETYAPASLLCIFRMMLIIAAELGLDFEAIDFSSAFINAKLEKPIYIRYPRGMGKPDRVLKTYRCIYGLVESPRRWNILLVKTLEEFGFKQSKAFTSIFYHPARQMYVSAHVDDLLIVGRNKDRMDLREFLTVAKGFKVTVEFEPKDHLGIEITREQDGSISVSQPIYISKLLEKFGMADCNPVSTPSDGTPLTAEGIPAENVPYRELIGTLIYLMLATRPDISWTVKELARFSHAPTKAHWKAAKRVLGYLKKTKDLKITYSKSDYPFTLESLVDSDWSGQADTKRSSSCYLIYFKGHLMGWRSWTQKIPAHSSAESELVGLDGCLRESAWFRNGLIEIDLMTTKEPTQMHIDNSAARQIFDAQSFRNVRHMDLKYQYSLHEVLEFKTELNQISTTEMTADIGTKGLPKDCHCKHLSNMFANVKEVFPGHKVQAS